jgi:GNAT superfamily N-acetyltransferase
VKRSDDRPAVAIMEPTSGTVAENYTRYCVDLLDTGWRCQDSDSEIDPAAASSLAAARQQQHARSSSSSGGSSARHDGVAHEAAVTSGTDDALDGTLRELQAAEWACEAEMQQLVASSQAVDRPSRTRELGHVLPYLLVGSISAASDRPTLAIHGVTHVINCSQPSDSSDARVWEQDGYDGRCTCREFFERGGDGLPPCQYLCLRCDDDPSYLLLDTHAETAHAFIELARQSGGVCFVHCTAGRNRSVALCAAHLLLCRHPRQPGDDHPGWSLARVMGAVGSARPQCLGNEGFVRQLVALAHAQGRLCSLGASSVSPAEAVAEIRVRTLQCGEATLLATWHAREFQGRDTATRARDYTAQSITGAVPATLVASAAEWVLGSVAVVVDDADGQRPALTGPWLASLFVHPAMRRRGAASQLVAAAERLAARNGNATLYLWTPHEHLATGLYARLGWTVIEALEGEQAVQFSRGDSQAWIMEKEVTEVD